MRIVLPSLGYYGTKSVELRQPTLDDIRAMHSMNVEPDLCKVQLVRRLTDVDFNTITAYDLEYLYQVSAFAILFNSVIYTVTCPKCGKEHDFTYVFGTQDLTTLPKLKRPYKQKIGGVEQEYHVLTAQNQLDAIEYAMTQDDYQIGYEDAVAAFVLGFPIEDVDKISSLDLSVYISAHLFHKVTFHGVKLVGLEQCPDCKGVIETKLNLPPSILKMDLASLMKRYNSVSDKISFEAFVQFTVPEYKNFIDSLTEPK